MDELKQWLEEMQIPYGATDTLADLLDRRNKALGALIYLCEIIERRKNEDTAKGSLDYGSGDLESN